VVVLINQGTASAGEITAGAIKENGRGILVGKTTFGTGTVLNQFSLSDGSAILLGVTNWLTPEGNLIKGQGVEPDIVVEVPSDTILLDADLLSSLTASELAESTDLQFLQALEEILSPMNQQERATTGRGSIR
jgi:carboxyl-terminal processing protease